MSETISPARLIGTWRLIKATAVAADGTSLPPPYGPIAMGRIIFNVDGRMLAAVCDGRPSLPNGIARAYASYAGNFTIDGATLVTHVDAALDPTRVGGQQRRALMFRADTLVMLPPRRADGSQRELLWTRDGPP